MYSLMLSLLIELTKGIRKAPNLLHAYRGFIKVTWVDNDEERGRSKVEKILTLDNLGCKRNLGFGKGQ